MGRRIWLDLPADKVETQHEFILFGSLYRFTVVLLDAELATDLLAYNTQNRRKKRSQIDRLKAVLEQDGWDFNGTSFVFSNDDKIRMLDGQNRATAIVEADAVVPVLLVEGVEDAAGDSLDQNSVRSAADILDRRGVDVPYKSILISSAGILLRSSVNTADGRKITKGQIADFAEHNQELMTKVASWALSMNEEAPIAVVNGRKNSRTLSPGPLTALTLWVIKNGVSLPLWERFIRGLATGMYSTEHDRTAFTAMRRRLTTTPLYIGGGGSQYTFLLLQMGVMIHTYNRWVRGESISVVKDYTQKGPSVLADLPKPSNAVVVNGEAPVLNGLVGANVPTLEDGSPSQPQLWQGFGLAAAHPEEVAD